MYIFFMHYVVFLNVTIHPCPCVFMLPHALVGNRKGILLCDKFCMLGSTLRRIVAPLMVTTSSFSILFQLVNHQDLGSSY